jgi:hypothetical protein
MALNLWTLNGQPSSKSPIPSGNVYSFKVPVDGGNKVYILSFYASSQKGGRIQVATDGQTDFYQFVTLNSTPKFFTLTFTKKLFGQSIGIFDDTDVLGDVSVSNISLVQAPLAKNTINAVDGFLSGKWSISNNAVVSDDVTLHLNTASPWDNSTLILPVLPNTTYNFSCFASSNGISLAGILVGWLDSNNVTINSGNDWACNTLSTSVTNISGSLTSPSNAVKVSVMLTSNGSGVFTFNKPMLNLGSIPAPYEPKRGDKMVLPTVKKNLIEPVSYANSTSGQLTYTGNSITVINPSYSVLSSAFLFKFKPNTTYTFSVSSLIANTFRIQLYKMSDGSTFYDSGQVSSHLFVSFTTGSDTQYYFKMHGAVNAVYTNPQLEEGTTATPFAPYSVQVNPKPKRVVPKKNLYGLGDLTVSNNVPNNNNFSGSAGLCDIRQGLVNGGTYTLSGYFTNFSDDATTNWRTTLFLYYTDGTFDSFNNGLSSLAKDGVERFVSITGTASSSKTLSYIRLYLFDYSAGSPVHRSARNVQVEQSSTSTPFEAYQLVVPSAQRGLAFGGNDYIEIPNTTLSNAGSFTITFSHNGVPSSTQSLIGKHSANGSLNGVHLYIGQSGYVIAQIKGSGGSGVTVNSTVPVCDCLPHTATFIYDQVNLPQIIVDGVNVTASSSQIFNFDSSPIRIGKSLDSYWSAFNGTVYRATIKDGNGNVLMGYDFTNPRTVTGTTVLTNGNTNLLPSFDSGQWAIHANAKVLGKDVLHLDATGLYQSSRVNIPFSGNTKLLALNTVSANIWEYDASGTQIKGTAIGSGSSITTQPTTVKIQLELTNTSTGSFDFIRPQLYLLNGTEGTINGSPKVLQPHTKRRLFSKR